MLAANEDSLLTESPAQVAKAPPAVFSRLTPSHAGAVNAGWRYPSLETEREMEMCLTAPLNCSYGAFVGSEHLNNFAFSKELVSWIVEKVDGSLGVLCTKPEYRRQGLAKTVAWLAATNRIKGEDGGGGGVAYCFVEPGNLASKKLFGSLGFQESGVTAFWGVFEQEAEIDIGQF